MGYALLFETMLDSVLAARDRWLAPGGVVLPDLATVFVAGASTAALDLGFWQARVCGLCIRWDRSAGWEPSCRTRARCARDAGVAAPGASLAGALGACGKRGAVPRARPVAQDVYGFSMEPIAAEVRRGLQGRAHVVPVDAKHITTNTVTAKVRAAAGFAVCLGVGPSIVNVGRSRDST